MKGRVDPNKGPKKRPLNSFINKTYLASLVQSPIQTNSLSIILYKNQFWDICHFSVKSCRVEPNKGPKKRPLNSFIIMRYLASLVQSPIQTNSLSIIFNNNQFWDICNHFINPPSIRYLASTVQSPIQTREAGKLEPERNKRWDWNAQQQLAAGLERIFLWETPHKFKKLTNLSASWITCCW